MSLQIECFFLQKKSQSGEQKDWEIALLLLTKNIWWLCFSTRTVFTYFCILRLAKSPTIFPTTRFMSSNKKWVLADPQQMEYRSCGLPWTDWDWVRPFCLWMNWKILKFVLPVVDFRANGEREHGKDTGCLYSVVSYSLQTWEIWLCIFSKVVRVRLRPCTPQVRLWVKRRKQLSLSACIISTWCAFFFYYTTWWRQFYCEYLLVLPSCLWCTQVWSNQAGYCFRVRKNVWILYLLCFSIRTRKLDSLLLHMLNCWRNV